MGQRSQTCDPNLPSSQSAVPHTYSESGGCIHCGRPAPAPSAPSVMPRPEKPEPTQDGPSQWAASRKTAGKNDGRS